MKENLLKNKIVGGEHTEIALEIHKKETEGVLIMQLSLQLSRLEICYSTFCDDPFICLICISIFVITEVFEDGSLTGGGCFFTYVLLYL